MKKSILLPLLLMLGIVLHAQQVPPFWKDILNFKKQDSTQAPAKGAILLIGSSSFTKWKDVGDYFPGYNIINRGFGGSTLPDVIRYVYDIALPYEPKQVIIYCGENDLASSESVSAAMVVARFKTLYGMLRQNLPTAKIDFISMKPSPSRKHIFARENDANAQIKHFLKKQKNAGFIDIYAAMLDSNGNTRAELYLDDQLHMKPAGYQIWKTIMMPFMVK